MGSKIFLFVGFVLLAVTALLYFTLDGATIKVNGRVTNDPHTVATLKYYLCCGLGLLGGLFAAFGVKGMMQASQQAKRNQYIMQYGIEVPGTVTFVDKNYTLLVNNRPIYSIVEYTYKDKAGNDHVRRINNMNSEIVIRKQIVVGAAIQVKYAPENPAESVMVLMV